MILILSTCKEKLSEEEFVKPIAELIGKGYEIKHYNEKIDYSRYDKIIICGTALADNDYLDKINSFEFLKETNASVLGICSGMQIIGLVYRAQLTKNKEIGMIEIKHLEENTLFDSDLKAYALHGNALKNLDDFEILAMSKNLIQAIKHKDKDIYGIMFHPEVRNQKIISNFLNI